MSVIHLNISCPFLSSFPLGSGLLKRSPQSPSSLCCHWTTMTTQLCRVVELMMRSGCCQNIRSRSCLRKVVFAPVAPSGLCVPGAPVLHRRAYSLDSLSSGPSRPSLGPSSQQPRAERTSPSSALTQRNLSAVAVQVGSYLWLGLILDTNLPLQLGFTNVCASVLFYSILINGEGKCQN